MKKLFPLISGLLLLSSFSDTVSNAPNDSQKQGLRGKVHYMRERTYLAVAENGYVHRGGRYLSHSVDRDDEMWFDEEGYFTSRKYYDQNDSLREIRYFRYDDKKRLLTDCTVYRNGEFADCIFYSYNSAGHVRSKKNIYMYPGWENLFRSEITFQYNTEGHVTMEVLVDSVREDFCYARYFHYNGRNQMTGQEQRYSDGGKFQWKCEYDDRGNLIREYEPFSVGHASVEYHWFYENPRFPNKVSSEIRYCNSLETAYSKYEYFDNGRLWKEESSRDTSRSLSSVVIYNEYGDLVDENSYYDSRLTKQRHYEYKYDEHGNWISVTRYIDGAAQTITERTISYY